MCPPEIGFSWSDEQVFLCLESIQSGSSLPINVISDINPYLHEPSNLPEGIWYVVYSKDPKQAEVGFWKAKDDPCQIYSNSSFIGWRTTLEFYEGQSPNDHHRTHWVMQDYSITDNISSNGKDQGSLCRVFLSDEQGKTKAIDDVEGQINQLHDEDNKSLKRKLHEEMERYRFMERSNQENSSIYSDCFEEGDFLEIHDLDDDSSSSSSDNSSCVSQSSDLYFDSVALLRELEDEVSDTKDSPTKSKIKTIETVKAGSSNDAGASSSRRMPGGNKGKKIQRGKMMKKFFCFVAS